MSFWTNTASSVKTCAFLDVYKRQGCQLCKTICTDFAPLVTGPDQLAIDRTQCVACGMCYNRCPNKNIEMLPIK